jgi:MoxR-like ATPase
MKFTGTENYVASPDLQIAVNAAVSLQKPLLIKGEPGTGKTLLAFEVSKSLNKKIFTWHVKSTSKAQQGLYEYDAVARLRDSQLGDEKVKDISHYINKGPVWQAFECDEQVVLLIDEIDKADIEFPNDLLLELDKMEFYCYELQRTIIAKHRPIIIITSNNERDLPDAFLRRCFFHFISFPEKDIMQKIVDVHFPNISQKLVNEAMRVFYNIRDINNMKKKPSTSELIDWMRLLQIGGIDVSDLKNLNVTKNKLPFEGALLKNEQDVEMLKRLGNKSVQY